MRLTPEQLTLLLNRVVTNPGNGSDSLYQKVYGEMHRIASRYMAKESSDHTLQVTGLVHEAYLEMFADADRNWANRAHFYGYTARVMRHILVRHARKKKAEKRGGHRVRTTLAKVEGWESESFDLLALNEALEQLERWDARKARMVELRFLAGLSIGEVARVTGLSEPSVYKDLKIAKGWLYHALSRSKD